MFEDFGKITVPTKWEQVTLRQFTDIMRMENRNDVRKLLSILTGKDEQYINDLPAEFVESMLKYLTFMKEEPKVTPKPKIGKYIVNTMEKMKFGEYVDVNTIVQNDPQNYAAILSVICRKPDEKYDEQYIENLRDKREEYFNSLPITDILPIITFFLELWTLSKQCSQDFLTKQKEMANQLILNIENSLKKQGWSVSAMKSRIVTIRKLRRYKRLLSKI